MRRVSRRDDLMQDDEFSLELSEQGDTGRYFRVLYLREPMITYRKRVEDESILY